MLVKNCISGLGVLLLVTALIMPETALAQVVRVSVAKNAAGNLIVDRRIARGFAAENTIILWQARAGVEKIQISFHSSKPGCRRTAQQEHPCTWIGSQSDIDARILACQIQRGAGPEVDEDGVLVVESNERPRQYFDYCYTITELDESGQKINELDPRVRVY